MNRLAILSFVAAFTCWQTTSDVYSAPRKPWTTSRISGDPYPGAPYQIRPVFPNLRFQRPTSIEEIPNTNRLMITEIGGKIHSVQKGSRDSRAELVIDLAVHTGSDATAFDAEFHPDFPKNRQVFVCYVHPGEGGHTRVSRFELSEATPPKILPRTEQVIITWPKGGHNGGCLEFGKEGYLYISTGDGSGPNPPDGLTTGQNVSDLLGAILRIDVDRTDGERAYRIPTDNPFHNLEGARPEIWAYGLRNPWKIGVDRETGDVFAADNGWETWELVHRIVKGGNCGWPVMEGPDLLRSEVAIGPTPIIPPFKEHPHTEANSVIGGPVYRGQLFPDLSGWFIYGDYITGTIWAVKANEDKTASFRTLADTDLRLVSFTEGSGGEVYLLDYDSTEQIYELIPSDPKDTPNVTPFPTKLSDTGLFRSLKTLEPMPGVVPYEVRVPRWMDGAEGKRWIGIPGNGAAKLASESGSAEFPKGTVLVKQLNLPQANGESAIRLETQLLHYESGTWRPYSYVWNELGSEATLVGSVGLDRYIETKDASGASLRRRWHISAQNECRLCHNADVGFVLGFTPNQLEDQLSTLTAKQVLKALPQVPDKERLVNPHDASQNLNDRARSYLHTNCAMCHRPGGSAIASIDLLRDLSFEQLRTNKGTGIGTFGIRHAKVITNGDPFRSVLMYRMSKLGYSRMPYIGTQVVDSAGVALVAEWIRSLEDANVPKDDTLSPPLMKDSVEGKALALLSKESEGGREERDAAIRALTKSTEGSLALVSLLHGGSLPEPDATAAIAIGNEASDTDIRGLFETFIPESKRRNRLGPNIDPQQILSLTGTADRGKTIFFGDGALCKACHHPRDKKLSIGTTLVEISKKYRHRSELLRHILEPSLRIDEPFASYKLELTNGTTINGVIAKKSNEAVVVKTAELNELTIPTKEIREMQKSPHSPMPAGLLSDLTAQEAADLLEYILSISTTP
jgi:putative heme-binding domain-containing protein